MLCIDVLIKTCIVEQVSFEFAFKIMNIFEKIKTMLYKWHLEVCIHCILELILLFKLDHFLTLYALE